MDEIFLRILEEEKREKEGPEQEEAPDCTAIQSGAPSFVMNRNYLLLLAQQM